MVFNFHLITIQNIKKIRYLFFYYLLFPLVSFADDDYGLPNPEGGVQTILENFLYWLLGIFGFLALISFIIAGFMYLFAAGDETKIKEAKRHMVYSIIGVVVALSGLIIITTIDSFLKAGSEY